MTSSPTPPVRKSADRILLEEAWAGWLPQMLIVALLAGEGLLLFLDYTGELPLTLTIAVLGGSCHSCRRENMSPPLWRTPVGSGGCGPCCWWLEG